MDLYFAKTTIHHIKMKEERSQVLTDVKTTNLHDGCDAYQFNQLAENVLTGLS